MVPFRHLLTFLIFIGWLLNLYMRSNFSIAILDMTGQKKSIAGNITIEQPAEFNWTTKEQTFALSSFNYGYIFSPLGGIIATKYGGATIYGAGFLVTGLLTILSPWFCKINFYLFNLARILEGFFEGASISASALIYAEWIPPKEQGRSVLISQIGSIFGAAINYALSGYISQNFGWEYVFYISGLAAVIWYIFWFTCATNKPSTNAWISVKERIYIEKECTQNKTSSLGKQVKIPWRDILLSSSTHAYVIHRICFGMNATFFFFCIPIYLKGITAMDVTEIGLWTSLLMLLPSVILPINAVLFDYIPTTGWMSISTLHKSFLVVGYSGQCLILPFLSSITKTNQMIIAMLICRVFGTFIESTIYILPVQICPRYSAILTGIGITANSFSHIVSPTILGFVISDFDNVHQWHSYFMLLLCTNLIGCVIFLLFGSAKRAEWDNKGQITVEKEYALVDTCEKKESTLPNQLSE